MGLTFDSPISVSYTAQDKANKHNPRGTPLPPPKTKAKRRSISSPTSFLSKFRRSSISSPQITAKTTPALKSSFFRLPLRVREKIYEYVVGRGEVFHILLKRKASPPSYFIGHRKCRAGGERDDCIIVNCKQFLDVVTGFYFGSFDSLRGLLLSCRDMHKEASRVLYGMNTFDFDHPLSLLLFSQQISPSSLSSIRSFSLDLGKFLFDPKSRISCKSFSPEQWVQAWDVIAGMEGLEDIRVNFRTPIEGWMSRSEKENLEPLWKVRRELKVFEVEAPSSVTKGFDVETDDEAPFTLVRDVQFPRR